MRRKNLGALAIIFLVVGMLVYSKRKPREYFHYKGEIFADQAGYYMYLPGAFIYDFDGQQLPDSLGKQIGYGFHLDSLSSKMITKYAVGVAVMQSPFFGFIHLHTKVTGGNTDGFSGNYHNVPNWASWFYASMGLWLFFLFLKERVQKQTAWLMIGIVFFGTSTYYYSVDNTGMSHVYSFFLFSAFLFVFDGVCKRGFSWKRAILLGGIAGLIISVRPVNVLFLPMAVFYLIFLNNKDWQWVKGQVSLGKIVGGILVAVLMLAPQLLYWKYTSGSFIHYSYGSEGFSNWKSPMLLEFWFAPLAGLFLYSPAYLLAIVAMFRKVRLRENQVLLIGFLGFCYLMASWHVYFFGCSFGSRNLVEFGVLFFIPLALWVESVGQKGRKTLCLMLILCGMYTINLMVSYSGCYYSLPWQGEVFKNMLTRGVYYQSIRDRTIRPDEKYGGMNCENQKHFTLSNYLEADVHIVANGYSEKTELALEVTKDSIIQFSSFNMVEEGKRDEAGDMYYTFLLPKDAPKDAVIKIYVVNEGKDKIYVDKLSVWLR